MYSLKDNALFPLLKYFSVTSSVLIFSVAIILAIAYRQDSIKTLTEYGEQSNVVLTQAVSNTIWPFFKPFATQASGLSPQVLAAHPTIKEMHALVTKHIRYTPILKVKLFDMNGKTLYSTDARQIGTLEPVTYSGSIVARTGEIISEFSHREKFNGPSGELFDRDVVSSYVPIRDADASGNGIVGVIEVYYDVTSNFEEIGSRIFIAFLFISALLGILYFSLYVIVRRADKIIRYQSINLRSTLETIRQQADKEKTSAQYL